jgi:hypothetical protein
MVYASCLLFPFVIKRHWRIWASIRQGFAGWSIAPVSPPIFSAFFCELSDTRLTFTFTMVGN